MSILAASRASPPAVRRNEVAELRAQIEVLAEMSGIPAADVRAEASRRIRPGTPARLTGHAGAQG